jgi:hypothetical protein
VDEAETHYETRAAMVVTDNWPTKFITTKPTLTPRQARWMITLAEFDLEIVHKPGTVFFCQHTTHARFTVTQFTVTVTQFTVTEPQFTVTQFTVTQ